MYTVSRGPSKLVAKTTRRGISKNYETYDVNKKQCDTDDGSNSSSVPRPVFFSKKGTVQTKFQHNNCNEGSFSPHHLEIVNFINESWKNVASKSSNVIDPNVNVEQNENNYFCNGSVQNHESSTLHYVGRPNQCLSTFKPFDIEAWWGRRLFNNITKNV